MSPIEFFREFRPHLDDAHLEKGYALLNDARGEVGTDAKHLEVITTANRVKKAAIDAGLLPATGKANDNEVKAFAQFERLVDDRVRQFEATDLQGKRRPKRRAPADHRRHADGQGVRVAHGLDRPRGHRRTGCA